MFKDSAASRLGTMGSGIRVVMRTVCGSTAWTSWPKLGGHVSLASVFSLEVMARSMVNLTDSAVNSSPLWNLIPRRSFTRSEEHTSELQSQSNLVCRLLLEKKKAPVSTCGMRTPPSSCLFFPRTSDSALALLGHDRLRALDVLRHLS